MISLKELNPLDRSTSPEIQKNLYALLSTLNSIRSSYGVPMTITSGFRAMEDHLRIYRDKGITDPAKIPMKSKHLYGQAADIADADGKFWSWCQSNLDMMEKLGVYFEDRKSTPTWVHIQIVAPASGKRIFIP